MAKIDQRAKQGGQTAFIGVSFEELRGQQLLEIVEEQENTVYESYGGEIIFGTVLSTFMVAVGVGVFRFYTNSAAKASVDAGIIKRMSLEKISRVSLDKYNNIGQESMAKSIEMQPY